MTPRQAALRYAASLLEQQLAKAHSEGNLMTVRIVSDAFEAAPRDVRAAMAREPEKLNAELVGEEMARLAEELRHGRSPEMLPACRAFLDGFGVFIQVMGNENGVVPGVLAQIAAIIGPSNWWKQLTRFAAAHQEFFGSPPEDWPPIWLKKYDAEESPLAKLRRKQKP